MKLFWLAFPAFLPGNRHMHSRLHVRRPTHTNQLSSFLLPIHSPKSLQPNSSVGRLRNLADLGLSNPATKSSGTCTLSGD